MTVREQYTPGPASGAQIRKDGEKWTLILVRELRHSPEKVWQALTDQVWAAAAQRHYQLRSRLIFQSACLRVHSVR